MNSIRFTLAGLAMAALLAAPAAASAQKYVGVGKCKTCHDTKDKGTQITKWKASPHAKAYETLAGDEAKKVAKAKGIADPQKDAKCLKCHVTGAGEPADKFAASFKKEDGIGCESCHGPGEKHIKARMASEDESEGYQKLPPGEFAEAPGEKTCLGCHNKESPTYKPFKYAEAFKQIAHPDPRKQAKK